MKKWQGFTIVELLIVIVVIGILAAITIVAYNGVQSRARDTTRQQDLKAIAKLLSIYAVDNGVMGLGSGCGSNGNGSGWFNYESGTNPGYPTSMNNCLKNANITSSVIKDPSGSITCSGASCRAYMKYTCVQTGSNVTYIYANLENPQLAMDLTGTCGGPSLTSSYGMNYYIKITD